jgi:hypothetical protein
METNLSIEQGATDLADKPATKRITSVQLSTELLVRLDRHARLSKVSRNWIIERVLEGWCDDQRDGF